MNLNAKKARYKMDILGYANLKAHNGRPRTPWNKKLTFWQSSDNFLHCCFESEGCHYSRKCGACIMCDYGIGSKLSVSELQDELEKKLLPRLNGIETILLGTYGSILDENEVSGECFETILRFFAQHPIKCIIFETHYSTVTTKKLKKIREFLPNDVSIIIEMGYESCDDFILKHCLRKVMDLKQLKSTITKIHEENMLVCLNVFVGAPFISVREQTLSSVRSIEWAFCNGADSVVVFPSNIKPFTLLYELYKNGYYSRITHWQVLDVLNKVSVYLLDKISLSWYGNRENFYENNEYPLFPPEDCEYCHKKIFSFYEDFHNCKSSIIRKDKLRDLLETNQLCNCKQKYIRNYEHNNICLSIEQIEIISKEMLDCYEKKWKYKKS